MSILACLLTSLHTSFHFHQRQHAVTAHVLALKTQTLFSLGDHTDAKRPPSGSHDREYRGRVGGHGRGKSAER